MSTNVTSPTVSSAHAPAAWRFEFDRLFKLAVSAARRMEARRQRNAQIAALWGMNDRQLKDIGLSRGDIAAVERGCYETDDTRRLVRH